MMQEKSSHQSKLSVVSALKFFLKGNILFIFSSVTIYSFDITTRIFPSLFQQVYTDNIITHKNPEWFAPLMVFYDTQKELCKNHHYFIYEIYMDCVSAAVVTSGPIHSRRTGGTLYKHIKNSQVAGHCIACSGLNACTYSMLLYPYIL